MPKARWCARCKRFREPHDHEDKPSLFDDVPELVEPPVLEEAGRARRTDPDTSQLAAKMVKARATTARVLLLGAFFGIEDGLTDEEAARIAGVPLSSEYATRCSELRRGGLIEETGDTRIGASGARREVSRMTPLGERVFEERAK